MLARKSKEAPAFPPELRSRSHGRILILLLVCGSLAMIDAVWWYYTVQKRETEAATGRELFAVADAMSQQVANWRQERIAGGRAVMVSLIAREAEGLLAKRPVASAYREDLVRVVSRMAHEFLYAGAALVDLDGEVRLRLFGPPADEPDAKELAHAAISAHDAILSDLFRDGASGRARMELAIPVGNLGALMVDIDPSRFLYPYLAAWPGASRTAEAYLVRREGKQGVYLSPRRNAPTAVPFFRRPLALLPPESVLAAGWSPIAADYRGIRAMYGVRHVPDSPWYLVAKMDMSEIDAPLDRLGWEMGLVTALIVVANVAGAGLIWRSRQARIEHEKQAWFYAVVNDTPAYLWMADPQRENAFINKPFAAFLGAREQSLSRNWTDYLHSDDAVRARANLLQSFASRSGYIQEFRVRRFDGEYRWAVSQGIPRFSPDGKFLGFAGSLLDVTDRKKAEEQLRSVSARLMNAQEEERKRLARELHDDLNQQIAALSIGMGNLKRRLPVEADEARAEFDHLHQKLIQLSDTVRRISHELHPAVLEYSGLDAALRASCEEFDAITGVRVALSIRGAFDDVPPAAALSLYRIAQEALQNVAKHSRASRANVELERSNGTVRLTVSDAGVGMAPERIEAQAGLGLISMKERMRLAGGTLTIESQPDHGVTITATLPVRGGEAARPTAAS